VFDAFTDRDHALASATSAAFPTGIKGDAGTANVTITSNAAGADIEVDGAYVGSTPSTLPLSAGARQISVRTGNAMWHRNLQINAGSSITINAMLEQMQAVARRAR
jgi:PEGA domain-containing protein